MRTLVSGLGDYRRDMSETTTSSTVPTGPTEAEELLAVLERNRRTFAWKTAMILDMIEEYARHTGHADILREAVDGRVGEGAPEDFII